MSVERYFKWMCDCALPFWQKYGFDGDGLFYELLSLEGRPQHQTELRLRTGMRQVYVFAHSALLRLIEPVSSLSLSERLIEQIRIRAWAPDGKPGWVSRFRKMER